MLVVPWAPSKVLWVSALSASQELHQQFSAWDFHLSQLNISKFKTKLLFPYSPSPFYGKSFPFHICTTHLFLPKQTNKQNNFFFLFIHYIQTSNNSISFASKICFRSAHLPLLPLLQSSTSYFCLSLLRASLVTWFSASAFHTFSTVLSPQAILYSTDFFKIKKITTHPCLKPSNGYPLYSA